MAWIAAGDVAAEPDTTASPLQLAPEAAEIKVHVLPPSSERSSPVPDEPVVYSPVAA